MTVTELKTPSGRRLFHVKDGSGHENFQQMLLTEEEAQDLRSLLNHTFNAKDAIDAEVVNS